MEATDGADLTLNERAVLMAQFRFADFASGRNSFVSEDRLAEFLQTSTATIRRSRRELRRKGWLIERKRGRNTGNNDTASIYEVVIPAAQSAPVNKPKRRANNPDGFNRHKRRQEVARDPEQEVKLTSNPSSQEVTGDHLSGSTSPSDIGSEATNVASSEVSADGVAGLGNDCDPVDRMQNVPPNCLNELANRLCRECQCIEDQEPHDPYCSRNSCPGCRDPWGDGHYADCPHS